MKSQGMLRGCVAALVLGHGLALASCTTRPDVAAETPARVAPAPGWIEQVGYGDAAKFVVCADDECPARTPKTLADPPAQPGPVPKPENASTPADDRAAAKLVLVHFATGSARLDAAARHTLDDVLHQLDERQRLLIEGRTDSVGSVEVNEILALRRAAAVKGYLVRANPRLAGRMTVTARGECCFIASNGNAAGRARNRRAVVHVSAPGDERHIPGPAD